MAETPRPDATVASKRHAGGLATAAEFLEPSRQVEISNKQARCGDSRKIKYKLLPSVTPISALIYSFLVI